MTSRRSLLLGGTLLLVLGAGLVHWRHPLKEKAKRLWSGMNPSSLDVGSSVVDQVPAIDRHTLDTADPPPFDRPSWSRSAGSVELPVGVLRPNAHFDFETSSDTSWTSTDHAHSGLSSMVIRAGQEYSPAIKRTAREVADTLKAVGVGVWLYTDSLSPRLTLVASVDRAGAQLAWMGKDLDPKEFVPGKWQKLQAVFQMDDHIVTGDDLITVYIWNRAKQQVYIDDMDVVYRSPGILGRQRGRAFDTETKLGTRPLPFAKVTFVASIDPATSGVVVGNEGPDIGRGPVPLAPGRTALFQWKAGDAVGRVLDGSGRARALVRAWCPEVGRDLLGFERVQITPGPNGIRIIGFDVDRDPASGKYLVSSTPAPLGAELLIDPPMP